MYSLRTVAIEAMDVMTGKMTCDTYVAMHQPKNIYGLLSYCLVHMHRYSYNIALSFYFSFFMTDFFFFFQLLHGLLSITKNQISAQTFISC